MTTLGIAIVALLAVLAFADWRRRSGQVRSATGALGLVGIERDDFREMVGGRKFSCLHSWVNTPYPMEFFRGVRDGVSFCLFSIGRGRNLTYLAVLVLSGKEDLPHFVIKPKSFTEEVGDMMGWRSHPAAYPSELLNYYDVSSETAEAVAPVFTQEMIGFFLTNEGTWAEVVSGALMVEHPLKSDPAQFETAITRTFALAKLLGMCGGHETR